MSPYAVASFVLVGLIIFLILLWIKKEMNTGRRCCKPKPKAPVCPECPPACPACPACPVANHPMHDEPQNAPPVEQPPLDKNSTTTDTNDCSGKTWKLPPGRTDENGTYWMFSSSSPCFVPGKSLTAELPDTTACQQGQSFSFTFQEPGDVYTSRSVMFKFNFETNTIEYRTGVSGWPANLISSVPNLKSHWLPGSNQVKFSYVSETEIGLYVNGVLMGSFAKDAYPIQWIDMDAKCVTTDTYAKIS